MESVVVSLDLAKKLKEAGYEDRNAEHIWAAYPEIEHGVFFQADYSDLMEGQGVYPAPTASEIAEVLPKLIGSRFLHICYPATLWLAGYTSNVEKSYRKEYAAATTMADALAMLWIKIQD